MLWGIVFLSHQVGSFLGGWGAGRWFDIEGNYDFVWFLSVAMGFVAAVLHWLIREEPVIRPKASFA
jgi:predicted MFS family arabinose efflux permease